MNLKNITSKGSISIKNCNALLQQRDVAKDKLLHYVLSVRRCYGIVQTPWGIVDYDSWDEVRKDGSEIKWIYLRYIKDEKLHYANIQNRYSESNLQITVLVRKWVKSIIENHG